MEKYVEGTNVILVYDGCISIDIQRKGIVNLENGKY